MIVQFHQNPVFKSVEMSSSQKISALESRADMLEKKIAAMEELLGSKKNSVENTDSKPKSKRGPNAWSLFVKHVSSEMKKASPDTKIQLSQIASEASKRKLAGEYDEAHWKAEAEKCKSSE